MITKHIEACIQDMHNAVATGRITLEARIRAYDLIQKLLELPSNIPPMLGKSDEFCKVYQEHAEQITAAFDEVYLHKQAALISSKYETEMNEALAKSQKAEELHEAAKSTFDIWQKGGCFARYRALHRLRDKAGFRLESNRIGNYVAKTFDLMNEAKGAYALAQQRFFASNVTYKINAGTHSRIACLLKAEN
jgi:hypothetical protein